jgi:hypothetical protein
MRSTREVEDGGDAGKEVLNGRLPGELERESRCWFLISVGVKSAPSSREKKREERSDSSSSSWKWGLVRWRTDIVMLP